MTRRTLCTALALATITVGCGSEAATEPPGADPDNIGNISIGTVTDPATGREFRCITAARPTQYGDGTGLWCYEITPEDS